MEEIYLSVDIETNGPIPGPYSMLSIGCVALTKSGSEIGWFMENLKELPGAMEDPDTMEWWSKFPDAWAKSREGAMDAEAVMERFVCWVYNLCRNKYIPVMVCAPAGFDFTFMYWYMMNFTGRSPFRFSCVDVRSYVMAMRSTDFKKTSKRYWPKRWFPKDMPHTHVAVEDAREQGLAFINMLKENKERAWNKKEA